MCDPVKTQANLASNIPGPFGRQGNLQMNRQEPSTDVELGQMVRQFQSLDAYGRRCALAMMAGLAKLQKVGA